MTAAYVDMRIRILTLDKSRQMYPVEAEVESPGRGTMSFRGGWFELDEQGLLEDSLDLEKYGKRLYYSLFTGPVREAYDRALGFAHAETNGQLRLRLEIDQDAPELLGIRWEVLHHEDKGQLEPIATNTQTPFSRLMTLDTPPAPPGEYPVKILYAVANPTDIDKYGLAKIDVEADIRNMLEVWADLQRTGLVELTLMPGQSASSELLKLIETSLGEEGVISGPTSLDQLKSVLGKYQVFHFLGHGKFAKGKAYVFLESDEEGETDGVDEDTFTAALANKDASLKFVFLASCETARMDGGILEDSPVVGLASKLVASGIPAVIAMQDVIEMKAAQEITTSFYSNLFLHGEVDRALNQARYQVQDDEEAGWSVPVLFLRQAKLFKADPVRAAMEQIRRDGHMPFRPLPIEVAHLVGNQEAGNIQRYSSGLGSALSILDATDIIFGGSGPANPTENERAKFVLLIGRPGGAKTSQLNNIARHTVRQSMAAGVRQWVVPILVSLRDYPVTAAGSGSRIEQMVFRNLARYWPELTLGELRRRLEGETGNTTFRLLFDGSGDMSSHHRHMAWDGIREFAKRYPNQQFILTLDRRYYDSARLDMATDLLIMQPLSRRRVEEYLLTSHKPANKLLCEELAKKRLFDLAASPWLLIKMIEQANAAILPKSRVKVLRNIFRQMLSQTIADDDGRREWAEESLYRLAYHMYQHRNRIWDEEQVFTTMADVRQYREYSLDKLFMDLVYSDILVRMTPANVRFSRRGLQAFCCAQAIARMDVDERNEVVDDITASLGRLTRLRWWGPVLIFLSGLVDNPNDLLRAIDFGIDMTEGEQLFLMTRCLLEDDGRRIDATIRDSVINALIWRVHGATERRVDRRARAANFLGQLHAVSAADNLAAIVLGIDGPLDQQNQPASVDLSPEASEPEPNDTPGAGDSFVRLEAALALAEIMSAEQEELKRIAERYAGDEHPEAAELYQVLDYWIKKDVDNLTKRLRRSDGPQGICAMSAYALGDIGTPRAKKPLAKTYFQVDTPANLRWAVIEALTLFDPAEVTREFILPLLDEGHARRRGLIDTPAWQKRTEYYHFLVYLIGRIRPQEPIILRFLDNCVNQPRELPVVIGAMKALGILYAIDYQEPFMDIALGNFPEGLKELVDEQEEIWLRRAAIEALGHIGDWGCIQLLQDERELWPPELERALYLANQEINWRFDYQPQR